MATNLCLPLTKYSHATGVQSDNSVSWTHLIASDIVVIVKGTNTHVVDGELELRIIRGNSILVDAVVLANHRFRD